MREIKFRAWDNNAKKMETECGYIQLDGYGNALLFNDEIWQEDGKDGADFILMQYTGLHDKNGKEIYEGDIKDYGDYENFKGRCLYEVFWDEEHACFSERSLVFEKGKVCGGIDLDGEVIGNIHENPDLIS